MKDEAHNPDQAFDDEGAETTVERLAALPLLAYEQCREAEAKALGIRVQALDKEVAAARRQPEAQSLDLPEPAPWAEKVDGDDLLNQIAKTFCRYLALPHGAADTAVIGLSPPVPCTTWPGRNGASLSFTQIGPIPGPPPPCGIAKVLWRLMWHTSAP